MSRPLSPAHLKLRDQLRGQVRTNEQPLPVQSVMFWATIAQYNAGPPVTIDVTMSTGDLLPGLRFDVGCAGHLAVGTLVWGLATDGDYFICGVRA